MACRSQGIFMKIFFICQTHDLRQKIKQKQQPKTQQKTHKKNNPPKHPTKNQQKHTTPKQS